MLISKQISITRIILTDGKCCVEIFCDYLYVLVRFFKIIHARNVKLEV